MEWKNKYKFRTLWSVFSILDFYGFTLKYLTEDGYIWVLDDFPLYVPIDIGTSDSSWATMIGTLVSEGGEGNDLVHDLEELYH